MLRSKKWLLAVTGLALVITVMSCSKSEEKEVVAESGLTEWEESSQILNTTETEEFLYEKAKEEGKVVLYSISSRGARVAEAFNEKYPGVTCEAFDISTNELLEKVSREHEAGIHNADVIMTKDQDGSLYNEYVTTGIFYNYKPADIFSHIDPSMTEFVTPMYVELTQPFYNTEVYPDEPPIDNIWDFTREEWTGRFLMQAPFDNLNSLSWSAGFCVGENPRLLEEAYEEEFGEKLVLSDGIKNAGYEFLKRLHGNEPVYTSSADEVVEGVGTPGQTNPPIGFSASSKIRKVDSTGWKLGVADIAPNTGIPGTVCLYIVEGSTQPYAAKLLVRFMMGGTDGTDKGYEPFNTLGGWPVREDVVPAAGSTPLSEIRVSAFDANEIYNNITEVQDFLYMLSQN